MTFQKKVMDEKDDRNVSNFIPTTKPIETMVWLTKSDFESVNDGANAPFRNLVAKKMLFENGINVLKSQN